MYLGVWHPRDRIRRDGTGVAAGTTHVQAVALYKAIGKDAVETTPTSCGGRSLRK
jgi:hypothetical protein